MKDSIMNSFKSICLVFLLAVFCTACKKEPIETSEVLSPIWEKAFVVSSSTTINPIFNSNNIIYSPYDDPAAGQSASSKFIALDPETGESQWEWFNTLKPTNESFIMTNPVYSIGERVIFSNGPRAYAITGKNGKTLWQRQYGDYGSGDLDYTNVNLFFKYGIDGTNDQPLVKLDIKSGVPEEIVTFNSSDSVKDEPYSFIEDEYYIYYAVARANLHDENNYVFPLIVKYNLDTKEQVFESQISEGSWGSFVSQFHQYNADILIATVSKSIIGVSTETGEVLWKTNVKGSHTFAPLLITDTGLVYSNTDDKVYCIEGTTGQILWEIEPERHGISSRMVLHNGVLYYISGGLLYALDANTGEVLLALEAPSALNPKFNMNFQPVMTLDAENDRIYTASYSHAYCYPTLK